MADRPPPDPASPDLAPPTKPSALRRHAALSAAVPRGADAVLVGDSLAASWPTPLLEAALARIGARRPRIFNFGLPGDRVRTTRWRLRETALGHLAPRLAIVLVGTNDLGDGDPVPRILAGHAALGADLRALWPAAALLLVTLPWRAAPPGTSRPGFEAARRALNAGLAARAAREGLGLLDADAALGGPETAPEGLEDDRLHVSRRGYERLSARLAADQGIRGAGALG